MTRRTLAEHRLPWRIVAANVTRRRTDMRPAVHTAPGLRNLALNIGAPDWWHLGGAYVSLILGALAIVGLWTFFGG